MNDPALTADYAELRERLLIEQVGRCDVTVPDNDLLHPKSCVNCRDYRAGVDAVLAVLVQVGWMHDLDDEFVCPLDTAHMGVDDDGRMVEMPCSELVPRHPVYRLGGSDDR